MKNILFTLVLLISFISFGQTYTIKETNHNQFTGETTIEIREKKRGYTIPPADYTLPNDNWNKRYQKDIDNISRSLAAAAARGAFRTARQKAKDIISIAGKNLNEFKYIVITNISASKEKDIIKIRKVINSSLAKTNFILINNSNNLPEDLKLNPNLAIYLYIKSENVGWPFKNVSLSLTNANGDIIHQRVVNHDRTASFLASLVLQNIKMHPHKFNIEKAKNNSKTTTENSNNKDEAIKELKKLKELLDLGLITAAEFELKSNELKKIILN
jgi:hypothetical protein|tara:strand:+ start:67 stop:882 length:816 start_codon:yes stop_codon:yes gene_type:complete